MPYKVGKLYANMAPAKGTVVSVQPNAIVVKYEGGTEQRYLLGQTYGRMEGSVYKHELVTPLKVGQRVAPGDAVTYNTGFFEPDWLDPSRLVMKFGRNITVALAMTDEVYEDSSGVSQEVSSLMRSSTIKERSFVLDFTKTILDVKEAGAEVSPHDSLFTVLEAGTDYNNLSESSIELLKGMGSISPKAKLKGTIFRLEVKYNGELADMSPTMRSLAQKLDRQTAANHEGDGTGVRTNRVNAEYRSEGKNLMPGTLELKVFVEFATDQAVGDKGVFGSQMKSVVSSVLPSLIHTTSGEKVDALFSYRSILNRIVLSPLLIGTTNRLIKHISPLIAQTYFAD